MIPLWAASPFFILILCIAIAPLFFAKFWHRFENLILSGIAVSSLFILRHFIGTQETLDALFHTLEADYIPFMVLIFALYSIGTGLKISFSGTPKPIYNILFLCAGAVLSNFIGTTGASMLLIHPFLRWNRHYQNKTHLVVFFIMIVSNIGGSLTPLGDAPLFVGYLQGVPFFWTLTTLWQPWLLGLVTLSCLFYGVDYCVRKKENHETAIQKKDEKIRLHLQGMPQFFFIPMIILVLMVVENTWIPFLREIIILLIAAGSFYYDRYSHNFLQQKGHWAPVLEVARVFGAIFISMIAISLILKEGDGGAFKQVLALTNKGGEPNPSIYFWMSGIFSAFLDNAPTYLLFFKMVSDDPASIVTCHALTLKAISVGSVYFGAMTYIGNAPNYMVRTIAKQHGVHMPTFFGYMLWTIACLLPILFLIEWIWFH